jgi:hypothetical protein
MYIKGENVGIESGGKGYTQLFARFCNDPDLNLI